MRRYIVAVTAVAGLVVGGVPSQAHTGWDLQSLKGRWGYVEEFVIAESYGNSIGIITFDGKGGCSVEAVQNGGDAPEGRTLKGSCTYTLGRGGRGTIASPELPDLAFAIGEHGEAAFFLRTERQQLGWGEMRPMVVFTPDARTIQGRWAWVHPAELAGVRDISAGVMFFDGVGETSERYWENGGPNQNGARDLTAAFDYTVQPSGWVEKGSDRLLITGNGDRMYYMHTAPGNVGWGLLTKM